MGPPQRALSDFLGGSSNNMSAGPAYAAGMGPPLGVGWTSNGAGDNIEVRVFTPQAGIATTYSIQGTDIRISR